MLRILLLAFGATVAYGSHCPINKIREKCVQQPGGRRFLISNVCDPFNPLDPACYMRLQDDPVRTCCFCCELEGQTLQSCREIDETRVCTLPPRWLNRRVETANCYEREYHYIGNPLNVNRGSNKIRNIGSFQDCLNACQRYPGCKWVNWDGEEAAEPNTCWLKESRGANYEKKPRQGGVTGHRNSLEDCESMFTAETHLETQNQIILQTQNHGISETQNHGISETQNHGISEAQNGGRRPNPCPNGRLTENCYGLDNCVTCCTGEVAGTDGTPACVH